MADLEATRWSGDGNFTQRLVDALRGMPEIAVLRVEDAPASRADAGYNFIANEVFVTFAVRCTRERRRWLGVLPYSREIRQPALDFEGLPSRLAANPALGEPDYTDEGMIQYLRTERVVAPYQRRGIKVVEMVRIYQAATSPR
jgi:hypothetical protein